MRLKLLNAVALAAVALSANSAFALFDADVLVGKRWYDVSSTPSKGIASTETSVAAHVDPIPLVPVSFGVRLDYDLLNKKDIGLDTVDTAGVVRPGLDINAWLPLFPVFTPYVRVELPIAGQYTVKGKVGSNSIEESGTISGYDLAVGAKFHLIPLLALMVEYDRGGEKVKVDLKDNGDKVSTETDNLNSNAFLIGLQVGL